MMAVETPLGHPNDPVINRRDSAEDELERVLDGKQVNRRPEEQEGSRDYRGTDLPDRSHTPGQQWDTSSEEDHLQYQEDDDYGPTEHQQTAMTELQQLKLELGYIEDEPPVYDVADRLKQLNQELAEDPTPIDDDRERSIKFKDDLVDLVAPPPDYEVFESDDEGPASVQPQEKQADKKEEEPDQSQDVDETDSKQLSNPRKPSQEADHKEYEDASDDIQFHKMSLNSSPDSPEGEEHNHETNSNSEGFPNNPSPDDDSRVPSATESINGTQNSHSDYGSDTEDPDPPLKTSSANKDEERVVVEINGKFEYLSREELKARGDIHLLPPDDNSPRSDSSTSIGSFQPTPPKAPRPKTAAEGGGGARARKTSAPPRRAHSANPARSQVNHGSGLEDFNYNSPYALSPAQKKYLRYRQKQEQERHREERERQKEEEEKKKSANNDIFEAWLAGKRRQMGRDRQEKEKHSKEKKEEEEKAKQEPYEYDDASFTSGSLNEREKQDAFNAWMRTKQDQKKKEKFVRDHQQREIDEGWHSHSKEDNEKAYKRWLRKKNAERKKTGKEEFQRGRMQKLQERRTRKAMALARAIKQSQSFKYVDYYGYRN